ncbi:MAG: hypothetical protein E6G62_02400 [Actinobacteria bacterium]|nr:MAG: hypothetical protein E6G62_02400 [Actinomycetota bacterium]
MRLAAMTLSALCAVALGACGDTLQTKPIPHGALESMVISPFPVYWAGGSFRRLPITDATHDPSGSYSVQYGNCLQGGQGVCVAPLRIVTSPDNSFLPGGAAPGPAKLLRGVPAVLARGGRTIVIATGSVIVDIYATTAGLAEAAARTVVPINAPGTPQGPLPARLPDSGFGSKPLPSQTPATLGPLR